MLHMYIQIICVCGKYVQNVFFYTNIFGHILLKNLKEIKTFIELVLRVLIFSLLFTSSGPEESNFSKHINSVPACKWKRILTNFLVLISQSTMY